MDPEELQSLAKSIRYRGVLQPIGVKPVQSDATLWCSARVGCAQRRWQASDDPCPHRASVTARSRDPGDREPAAGKPVQRRPCRCGQEAFGGSTHEQGNRGNLQPQGMAGCCLSRGERFPPFLTERLNTADMRALYDLFRQWGHTPEAIKAAMPEADTYVTVTEARRMIGRITGKPTGSIVIAREEQAAA